MSTDLTILSQLGKMPAVLANRPVEDDLGAGIEASFGIISFRGKVWRIKHRGEETDLMREDGDGPRASIEVVIVKAAKSKSKIFYKNGYVEGSTEAPDCWSSNNQTPDGNVPEPQSATCLNCPHNQMGSRITPAGKPAKACSDAKRIAVVPMNDIANELYGGPMLLRVPAASLNEIQQYGQKLAQMGFHYYAVATRISFDTAEAYPKLLLKPIRVLTEEEAQEVLAHRDNPGINRILAEGSEVIATAPAAAGLEFEQPPVTPAGNGAAKPVAVKPAVVAKPAAKAAAKPAETASAVAPASNVTELATKAKEAAAAKAAAAKAAAAKAAAEAAAAAAAAAAAEAEDAEVEDEEVSVEDLDKAVDDLL